MRFSSIITLARCEPAFRTRRSWLWPRGGWRARVQSAFWLSARGGAGRLPDGSDVVLYVTFHRLDFSRLGSLGRHYYTRWAFDSWMEVLLVPLRPPHTLASLYGDDYGEFDSEDEFHVFAQRQFERPDSDDDRPSHPW